MNKTSLSDPLFHDLGSLRGVDDGADLTPIASAVVIGIGGSGVQTISRLRASVNDKRPDQGALSQVQFIGIDSVGVTQQNPELPAGVTLGQGEYVNLVDGGFDPSAEIDHRAPNDPVLSAFWKAGHRPPRGSVTNGLKRDRMLGHLAFYLKRSQIENTILSAMKRAAELTGNIGQGGEQAGLPTIPVYIVHSCAGGTGSSGFLEVVHAIWAAADNVNFYPEIRSVTFMPSVFQDAVSKGAQGGDAVLAHQANAYAFFREVDHFMVRGTELSDYFGFHRRPNKLDDGDLLKQMFLLGGMLGGVGALEKVTDVYDIGAEALYQFLMTNLGRPLVGVDATNTDQALQGIDAFDKPRRYCSLGISRVVYPQTTLKFHLYNRYIHLFLTEGLMHRPTNLESVVRHDPATNTLVQRARSMREEATKFEPDEPITQLRRITQQTVDQLALIPESGQAATSIERVEALGPRAARSIQQLTSASTRTALSEFENDLIDQLFAAGQGLPIAEETLRQIHRAAQATLTELQSSSSTLARSSASAEELVKERLKALRIAGAWPLHTKLLNFIESTIGLDDSPQKIATDLGSAIQAWAENIQQSAQTAAAVKAQHQLVQLLEALLLEIERAQEVVAAMARDARQLWEQDELLGKDAGAHSTSTFIPSDIQPEVDYCKLAIEAFELVLEEYGASNGSDGAVRGDGQAEFVRRWRSEGLNRAFFSLGAERTIEASKAEQTLTRALVREGRARALADAQGKARLPESLVEAASKTQLAHAVEGIADLSSAVLWNWDRSKLQMGTAAATMPTVSTALSRPDSTIDAVDGNLPNSVSVESSNDPDQIVALSIEWAVPFHTIAEVEVWHGRYEAHLAASEVNSVVYPPPHIDQRFAADLAPLVPAYFNQTDAAKSLAVALMMMRQFENDTTNNGGPLLDAYHKRTHSNPARPVLGLAQDGDWQVNDVSFDHGSFSNTDTTVHAGRTWQGALEAFGSNAKARKLVRDAEGWFEAQIGHRALKQQIDQYIEGSLTEEAETAASNPDELTAIRQLADEMLAWAAHLEQTASRLGS